MASLKVMPGPFALGCSILSVRYESAFSASTFDQSERKTRTCFPTSPTVTKPQALRFVRWPGTGRVAQPFGFRPHGSERAAFPHSAPPEGYPTRAKETSRG